MRNWSNNLLTFVTLALIALGADPAQGANCQWETLASMPTARLGSSAGTGFVNGDLIVVGDHDGNPGVGTINEIYDPGTDSWTTRSSYPRSEGRRCLNQNAVVGDEIYFFGGCNIWNNYHTTTVDKYNVATDVWTLDVSQYPMRVGNVQSAAHGGLIYLFGGDDYNGPAYKNAYAFDPATGQFSPLQDMPTGRIQARAFALNSEIWVVGGHDLVGGFTALSSIDIYNPATDSWRPGPPLPLAAERTWAAGSLDNGIIYAVFDPGLEEVYVYDESNATWTFACSPPQEQSASFGSVNDGNQIHLFGGGDPKTGFHQALTLTPSDSDGDGINDDIDNCPDISNPGQSDADLDGVGDACDADDDNDGVDDNLDNCQFTANPDQSDSDGDGAGDVCDVDLDGDGICEGGVLEGACTGVDDNCPFDPNEYQTDTDLDGVGDACDEDDDDDGVCDDAQDGIGCIAGPDNCPIVVNLGQEDLDGDGIGDACDADVDGDGICEGPDAIAGVCSAGYDNCPALANSDQEDTDGDGAGDACDADDDNDGIADSEDNCSLISNPDQADADADGQGDVCDGDLDGDGVGNDVDNCPYDANASQADFDGDGIGDACDPDDDDDGVDDGIDVCAGTGFGEIVDPGNGCSIVQLCPCEGPRGSSAPWRNHGKYVSCVAHSAESFADLLLISESEKDDIVSDAGQSACGHKNK